MAPYIIIGIFAIIGLLIWGIKGLLIGGTLGYIITVLSGLALIGISGGFLPRKIRKAIAIKFIQNYSDIVEEVYPNIGDAERQKKIEKEIEQVIKTSVELSPAGDPIGGLRLGDIQIAVSSLIE